MEFGDLKDDKAIQEKLTKFHDSVQKIKNLVELSSNPEDYDKLSTKEKIDFDLFMAYCLNTLFWLFLRTKGQDPNKSEVKNQLNRVRQYMLKAKELADKAHRPRVDQAAAERFIKHGIHHKDTERLEEPPNKKIKFET